MNMKIVNTVIGKHSLNQGFKTFAIDHVRVNDHSGRIESPY